MSDKPVCNICGKAKRTVQVQVSRENLIFGGCRTTYENRCQACETKLAKEIDKICPVCKDGACETKSYECGT